MTIHEIAVLPWAVSDVKAGWDFRNKTAEDLAPMCFGAYQKVSDCFDVVPSEYRLGDCRILYGGLERAKIAMAELAALGIESTLQEPRDSMVGNEVDGYSRIKGWSYAVHFHLP